MPKFNPNDYEIVEDRLKKFWKENPNGRVWTEVITVSEDGTMVVVKAMVYTDKEDTNPVSTGIAQELKGQGGFANADAWMENCETSAIGRALANWKYQGSNKKRPSAEEMAKVETSQQAAPVKSKVVSEDVKSSPVSTSSDNPIESIKDAGFGDMTTSKHPTGQPAMDSNGLLCICGRKVKYFKAAEKNKPTSPDFRCTGMGDCTAGDTVDGKVFAKSWWMDNKATPESWKDYAAVENGMKLPEVKSLDDVVEGEIPF